MTEDIFKENFRMKRKTFFYIVSRIGSDMKTNDTTFRLAIPVEKKIAIALKVSTTLRQVPRSSTD